MGHHSMSPEGVSRARENVAPDQEPDAGLSGEAVIGALPESLGHHICGFNEADAVEL